MTRYSITNTTAEQVKSTGGTNIKEGKATKIVFANLTDAQIAKLTEEGCSVNPVPKTQAVVTPPRPVPGVATYTLDDLASIAEIEEVRKLTVEPLYGRGINIAVLGTGIRETHEAIRGRVIYSKNFTTSPGGDQFNHDTAVASVILFVVPECGILDMKVLNDVGEGTEEEVVLAIEECIDLWDSGSEYAPMLINLSLGAPDTGDPSTPMRVACRAAIERNIWVSAAAGNSGPMPGTTLSPACERYVFATGSLKLLPDQQSFVISDFSSRGPTIEGLIKPDAVFFGEDIIMASSASDTATTGKSGTSFSTPFSTAVAALYLEAALSYTVVEILPSRLRIQVPALTIQILIDSYLEDFCIKPSSAPQTKDNDYGYGLPFGSIAVQAAREAASGSVGALSMITMVPAVMMITMMMKALKGMISGKV